LRESEGICRGIYEGCEDGLRIEVRSLKFRESVKDCEVEEMIERMMNLRHPCIAGTIGVIFGRGGSRELEIFGISSSVISLSEVVSSPPKWWTPTAKAKTIVSLVLGLRFAHSHGILHGQLTMKDVRLNSDGMTEIHNFSVNGFGAFTGNADVRADDGSFSGEHWTPKGDIEAFTTIFSEIVIGASGDSCSFVSHIIGRGQSADSAAMESFEDILKILKKNDFRIAESVDIKEVWNYVKWIEWSEMVIE
jgi:hypothetical protein